MFWKVSMSSGSTVVEIVIIFYVNKHLIFGKSD